jgi:hypothetical protein
MSLKGCGYGQKFLSCSCKMSRKATASSDFNSQWFDECAAKARIEPVCCISGHFRALALPIVAQKHVHFVGRKFLVGDTHSKDVGISGIAFSDLKRNHIARIALSLFTRRNSVKYAVPILLPIFAGVAPTLGHAESWAAYREDKCRLKFASSVFTRARTDTENFQRFSGPNKDPYFRVIGLPNEDRLTPTEIRAEYLKKRGTTNLVYEHTKRDFLVLSGFRGQNIFYTKIAVSPDNRTICVLHISYPRKAKRAFDAIVKRMSRSFAAEN